MANEPLTEQEISQMKRAYYGGAIGTPSIEKGEQLTSMTPDEIRAMIVKYSDGITAKLNPRKTYYESKLGIIEDELTFWGV